MTECERRKLCGEKNIRFNLEQCFLDLEYKTGNDFCVDPETNERMPVPDRDRWCFYVARDSFTLTKIGSEMYNCVGSYKKAVCNRSSTIVYAMFKGVCRICIELKADFSVRQAFGPPNTKLDAHELQAYNEWCAKKNIPRVAAAAS